MDLHNKDVNSYNLYNLISVLDFAIKNRVSYEHGLKGPKWCHGEDGLFVSWIELNEAIQETERGSIPLAIIAGASLISSPRLAVAMSVQAALSPKDSSKFFDARADEAISDGNPVTAVIRTSASNADGNTAGLPILVLSLMRQ
ncbi:hypothetical protein BDV36DRAFT_292547 [Aspergillus pseudocaelatus]|uniref:Beta-ketoacyl synthase-like N-terminal domain-containing protein n=1 Tax=Aspergillus pseudocaelatus TaxID=1825620 RepID=A0ABQ6WVI1_9EURO|nr:hypothetical protein BDV36DRAFT_292547 [Aspergillus pseudocaelatus]